MSWLWRSSSGRMVHTMECRHARRPWMWADDKTLAEVLSSVYAMGMRECRQCRPFNGLGRASALRG